MSNINWIKISDELPPNEPNLIVEVLIKSDCSLLRGNLGTSVWEMWTSDVKHHLDEVGKWRYKN